MLKCLTAALDVQDSLLEHVVDACEGDLKQYCNQVTPGEEGRIFACLEERGDSIGETCTTAIADTVGE